MYLLSLTYQFKTNTMSKTIRFQVDIIVSDKITGDIDLNEMSQNIANAIVKECQDGNGITPHEGDAYTEIVYVKEWYSDKQIIEHV